MGEYLLKHVVHEAIPDERVCDWRFISVGSTARLYYQPLKEEGFYFSAVSVNGWPSGSKDIWLPDSSYAELILEGESNSEGVRHLYVGSEGYMYIPDLQELISIFNVLIILEKAYCNDR